MWKHLKNLFRHKTKVVEHLQPAPVNPMPWDDSDRVELNRFFRSNLGNKLMQRARAVEYANAVAATKDFMHSSHSCGRASGFTECLDWLDSMATISPPDAIAQENTDDGQQNTHLPELIRF